MSYPCRANQHHSASTRHSHRSREETRSNLWRQHPDKYSHRTPCRLTHTFYHKRLSLFGAFPFGKDCLDFPPKHSTKFIFFKRKVTLFLPNNTHFVTFFQGNNRHFATLFQAKAPMFLHSVSACRSSCLCKSNIEL